MGSTSSCFLYAMRCCRVKIQFLIYSFLLRRNPKLADEHLPHVVYHKVPKFSDSRKLCCNLPRIQTKRPKLRVFYQNVANGIANSEDPEEIRMLL